MTLAIYFTLSVLASAALAGWVVGWIDRGLEQGRAYMDEDTL